MTKLVRNETLIGIFAAVIIAILVLGYNFLKGSSLFTKSFKVYAVYDNTQGLTVSNAVQLNGYTIGAVKALELNPVTKRIVATLSLTEEVAIPRGSVAMITKDLLGSASIQMNLGNGAPIQDGDTIRGSSEQGLAESVSAQVQPVKIKAEKLLSSLDSVATSVQVILASGKIQSTINSLDKTLNNFEATTGTLNTFVADEQVRLDAILRNVQSITSSLDKNMPRIEAVISNLSTLTDSLAKADIQGVLTSTKATLAQANNLIKEIKDGKGSTALLINDPKLYNNLERGSKELEELIKAFKNEPSKYLRVRISLFGKG